MASLKGLMLSSLWGDTLPLGSGPIISRAPVLNLQKRYDSLFLSITLVTGVPSALSKYKARGRSLSRMIN